MPPPFQLDSSTLPSGQQARKKLPLRAHVLGCIIADAHFLIFTFPLQILKTAKAFPLRKTFDRLTSMYDGRIISL